MLTYNEYFGVFVKKTTLAFVPSTWFTFTLVAVVAVEAVVVSNGIADLAFVVLNAIGCIFPPCQNGVKPEPLFGKETPEVVSVHLQYIYV